MHSPEVQRSRDLLSHLVSEPDADMADYRRLYEEVLANFELPDEAISESIDAGGVPAYWVSAPGAATHQVVVLVHGGGWCMGSAKGYREFGHRISKSANARVLVIDYRLAPENPYPAPLDDVVAAYRWARGQDGVRQVALVGDSAGGNLVLAAAVRLREEGETLPTAVVACSPVTDLAGESPSLTERAHLDPLPAAALIGAMGGAYLGGLDPQTPFASPLHADLTGLPPVRVLVGSDEGLHDDSVRLVQRLRDAGVRVEFEIGEGMVHIWPIFPFLPQGREATARFGDFLQKQFAATG